MKGLILKDLYALKKSIILLTVFDIVFSVLGILSKNYLMIIYPLAITGYSISMGILNYDKISRWTPYSIGLPVKRSQLMLEKYIVIIGITAMEMIVSGVVIGLTMLAMGPVDKGMLAGIVFGTFLCSIFSWSLMFPFMVKFGVEKGRILFILVYVVIFLLTPLVAYFFPLSMFATGMVMILTGAVVITAVTLVGSAVISTKIFEATDY